MHILVYGIDSHEFSESTIKRLITKIAEEANLLEDVRQEISLVFVSAKCISLIGSRSPAPIFEIKHDMMEGSFYIDLAVELRKLGFETILSAVTAFIPEE